jgi:hypothetical protein
LECYKKGLKTGFTTKNMSVFVLKKKKQLGPFSESKVPDSISRGECTFDDLAWMEGLTEWIRLEE